MLLAVGWPDSRARFAVVSAYGLTYTAAYSGSRRAVGQRSRQHGIHLFDVNVFLASDASSWLTGLTIDVAGGRFVS